MNLFMHLYRCTIRFPSTKLKIDFQILLNSSSCDAVDKSLVLPESFSSTSIVPDVPAATVGLCSSPSGTRRLLRYFIYFIYIFLKLSSFCYQYFNVVDWITGCWGFLLIRPLKVLPQHFQKIYYVCTSRIMDWLYKNEDAK